MKQTAVEQLGIAFIQWEKDRYDFVKTGKDKPVSYDKFIKPFLEMEKQQIIDAFKRGTINEMNGIKEMEKEQMINFANDLLARNNKNYIALPDLAEEYYNETFKNQLQG
jgi:hypothetical protein